MDQTLLRDKHCKHVTIWQIMLNHCSVYVQDDVHVRVEVHDEHASSFATETH